MAGQAGQAGGQGESCESGAVTDTTTPTPGIPAGIAKRRLTDVIEFLESLDGPAYGHEDSAVREWARFMVNEWLPGKAKTDRTMMKLFDTMTEKAPKGTKKDKEESAEGEKGKGAKKGKGDKGGK